MEFAGRFGPSKAADLLTTLHLARDITLAIQYYSADRVMGALAPAALEPFPRYEDKMGYAGRTVKPTYIASLIKDWDAKHSEAMNRAIHSSPGMVVQGDGSHKVRLFRLLHWA